MTIVRKKETDMGKVKEYLYCSGCGKLVHPERHTHYIAMTGEVLCEDCGSQTLQLHDNTQYDEYPLIDAYDEDMFDGGCYTGTQWRRVEK